MAMYAPPSLWKVGKTIEGYAPDTTRALHTAVNEGRYGGVREPCNLETLMRLPPAGQMLLKTRLAGSNGISSSGGCGVCETFTCTMRGSLVL